MSTPKSTQYENVFMPVEASILNTEQMTAQERRFTLRLKDGRALKYEPGQILEVSVFGYGEIPIGIASSPTRNASFDIVVRTVGRVSTAINRMEKGGSLWIRGPMGQGFPLDQLKGKNVLVIAGGIGLCPTRSLIQYILDRRTEFKRFTLLFGARTPQDLLFTNDLAQWRTSEYVHYHETVDRPDPLWSGNVGVITTLFQKAEITPDTQVVVCGPPVMYKFVLRELEKLGIAHRNIFLDLERRMKCGIGKCGHCQINNHYVCVDGPVMSYDRIKHLEEAFQ